MSSVQKASPSSSSLYENSPPGESQVIDPKKENPSKSNCMRVALILNFLVVAGLLSFFALYAAGQVPLENFTGMIGSSVFLTTSSILFVLSTILLVLNFRKQE